MKNYLFAMMLMLSAAAMPMRATADVIEVPAAPPDQGGMEIDDERVAGQLLERFRAAQLSLGEAILIAEKLHSGSTTTRIRFDTSDSPRYRVRTAKDDKIWDNVIDARTGTVQRNEITLSLRDLSAEDRGNIVALKSAKQELSDAVSIAEKAAIGKAFGGGLMNEGGKLKFVVVIVSGDRVKEVMLEPPRAGRQGSALRRTP